MQSRVIRGTFCLALLAAGCSNERPPLDIPEKSNAELKPNVRSPITQIRQTLNMTPQETLSATIDALRSREVGIVSADDTSGIIESDWVTMNDSVCSGHRGTNAPLSCRTRLSFKVESLPVTASALNVRYQELCAFNEEIKLECADSSAEKLMISIIEELKTLDTSKYPARRW